MLFTCISILAVDFQVFPRRFVKVEVYGMGLVRGSNVNGMWNCFMWALDGHRCRWFCVCKWPCVETGSWLCAEYVTHDSSDENNHECLAATRVLGHSIVLIEIHQLPGMKFHCDCATISVCKGTCDWIWCALELFLDSSCCCHWSCCHGCCGVWRSWSTVSQHPRFQQKRQGFVFLSVVQVDNTPLLDFSLEFLLSFMQVLQQC